VPLDGSKTAEEALPVAARLARQWGGRLHLVTVHEPLPTLRSVGEELDLQLEQGRGERLGEYLKWSADAVATTHGLEATGALLEGSPAEALAEHARKGNADLVVMTTHGHTGLSRFWLGSVADQLIRRVTVPVLLLHPDHQAHAEFRHILVALDGSPIDERVLQGALELGSLFPDASYSLVRVVQPPIPVITSLAMRPSHLPEHWQELEEHRAGASLDSIGTALRKQGIRVNTEVLTGRGIAEQIHDAAQASSADLIVVGTHGARGFERLLLGSVADKVIRGATQAVSVVPVGPVQAQHDSSPVEAMTATSSGVRSRRGSAKNPITS
jgi:nucleotide-binding universal stress UspA family protein